MATTDITNNTAAIAGKRFMPKVADATFKYNDMIAFVAKANTATQVNIQTTQDQIRAGQNNAVIGVITSEKTIDVSFSTPEWQPEFLAANIGEEIKVGNFAFEVTDLQLPSEDGIITLPSIPSNNKIYVQINSSWVTILVENTTVNLTSYGIKGEDCVSVIGMFNANGKRINLSVDTDPLVGELILTSPIFEGTKGKVGTSQYVFPAFALSGNWNQQYGSDSTYEISGQPIASSSQVCGEGQTYGYYQENVTGDDTNAFSMIVAAPSVVELTVGGESETLSVYGARGALYTKSQISGATFATEDTSYFTVNANTGEISPVSAGTGTVTVTYNNLITKVDVEVEANEG